MHTIHCHFCGGVVRDPATIQFRPPRSSAQVALPQTGTCTCTPPIVYEDSPLDDPPADDEPVAPAAPAARAARAARAAPAAPAAPGARAAPAAPPARPPDTSDPWKSAV